MPNDLPETALDDQGQKHVPAVVVIVALARREDEWKLGPLAGKLAGEVFVADKWRPPAGNLGNLEVAILRQARRVVQ